MKYLLLYLLSSSSVVDAAALWKCTDCEFTLSGNQLERINAVIEKEIESLNHIEPDRVIEESERLLRQYKSVLHPNHAFLTIIKHSLIQFYGRSEGYTYEDLPDILLERKAELCRQILRVVDVVEPGKTRLRGEFGRFLIRDSITTITSITTHLWELTLLKTFLNVDLLLYCTYINI